MTCRFKLSGRSYVCQLVAIALFVRRELPYRGKSAVSPALWHSTFPTPNRRGSCAAKPPWIESDLDGLGCCPLGTRAKCVTSLCAGKLTWTPQGKCLFDLFHPDCRTEIILQYSCWLIVSIGVKPILDCYHGNHREARWRGWRYFLLFRPPRSRESLLRRHLQQRFNHTGLAQRSKGNCSQGPIHRDGPTKHSNQLALRRIRSGTQSPRSKLNRSSTEEEIWRRRSHHRD